MDEFLKTVFFYLLSPTVIGIVAYFIRNLLVRLATLEQLIPTKLNEGQVRLLLSDHLDPIKEDIRQVNQKLDRMLDFLLDARK